jgi:hypothetical protein
MLINRLVDGPSDVMVDADKFNEQDRINSLRMYDKYIDDTKKLVTASGQVLNFNYNKREELKQYKAITKWLTVDGKVSSEVRIVEADMGKIKLLTADYNTELLVSCMGSFRLQKSHAVVV